MKDKNIKVIFDNEFITDLESLIEDNKDAVPITDEEAQKIRDLKIGESTFSGFIELTRTEETTWNH